MMDTTKKINKHCFLKRWHDIARQIYGAFTIRQVERPLHTPIAAMRAPHLIIRQLNPGLGCQQIREFLLNLTKQLRLCVQFSQSFHDYLQLSFKRVYQEGLGRFVFYKLFLPIPFFLPNNRTRWGCSVAIPSLKLSELPHSFPTLIRSSV